MADYTNSKIGPKVAPENALETEHNRLEPILSPEELRNRHIFGIPLVSQMQDPFSGRPLVMTDEMIKDIIEGAVNQAETELDIDIWPVKRRVKHPFDRNTYESFGYFQLEHRPITSLDKLSVTPANQQDVYIVPLEWVETSYLVRGQLNIIPMTAAFIQGGYVPAGSTGGSFFLAVLGNRYWVPAYWQIEYTSGYVDSMVPRVVNDFIGTIAALEILSMLAVTYARSQSHSLGIDGMSQSVSTPGPAIFQIRISELEEKKKRLMGKLKAMMGRKIFSSHV
jgi:hypothetical protein